MAVAIALWSYILTASTSLILVGLDVAASLGVN